MPEPPFVGVVEGGLQRVHGRHAGGYVHVDLPALAEVAHPERPPRGEVPGRDPLRFEAPAGLRLQPVQLARDLRERREAPGKEGAGLHEVLLHIGDERPERREVAGAGRHEHPLDLQLLRDERPVHRPRAAVCDEGEVARVVALRHRDLLDRAHHPGDRDAHHPLRGGLVGQRREVEGADRPAGEVLVEGDAPREARPGLQPVEHDVGVGHGRLPPALAVAGGAGVGPRAARPHHQDVARVHPRHAAPAGPDRVDLGLGGAVRIRTHELLVGEGDGEVLDEADVGAGAAHVAGDEVGEVEPPPEMGRRGHAPRRAGQHRGDRQPARASGRRDPAVRGHDEHRAPVAPVGDGRLEPGEVAVDEGADVGVEGGGVEAFVLPELRQHLARSGDEPRAGGAPVPASAGPLARKGGHRPLMVRVGVAVQEAHRDRSAGGQALHRGAGLVEVEGAEDGTVPGHPLVDLQGAAPGDEGGRLPGGDVVEDGAVGAGDLEHVAEAGRGQHPDLGPAPLEDRVRADGDPVDEAFHAPEVDPEAFEHVEHRAGGVRRGRGGLGVTERPRRVVEHRRVGEGPPHVHADVVSSLGIGHMPGSVPIRCPGIERSMLRRAVGSCRPPGRDPVTRRPASFRPRRPRRGSTARWPETSRTSRPGRKHPRAARCRD